MKIAILENLGCSKELFDKNVEKLRAQGHEVEIFEKTDSVEGLKKRVAQADVLLLANMPLPPEALAAAQNVKFIDVAFTGVDHIPMQDAAKRGITVSNASGYANDSVAELVLSLMVQLLRDLPKAEKRAAAGKTKQGLSARLLKGKTVGIIGAGAIGKTVAALCKAFGAKVIAHNRHPVADSAIDASVDLDKLLAESDIVTIHCPLTPETTGLVGASELKKMKKSAYLINTSRGGVVDNRALAQALNDGVIAGAAIDVFEMEPPLPENYPLRAAKNAILTPHLGFYTQEAMDKRAEIVFANLESWLSGKPVNVMTV